MVEGCVLNAFSASAELDVTADNFNLSVWCSPQFSGSQYSKEYRGLTIQCRNDLYIASVRYGASGSSMPSVYDASGASSQGPFSAASRISGPSWVSSEAISFPKLTSAPLG